FEAGRFDPKNVGAGNQPAGVEVPGGGYFGIDESSGLFRGDCDFGAAYGGAVGVQNRSLDATGRNGGLGVRVGWCQEAGTCEQAQGYHESKSRLASANHLVLLRFRKAQT